ncbi:hypothetical protein ACHAWC_010401 [Mediolabrus comicus]
MQFFFNARYCCGYALNNNIDDIGFIVAIQSRLSDEHDFIKPEYTYATGWSNGGFMVMHASNLFRAIAPISGFIGELDTEMTGENSIGKGLFIHQGRDDNFVRPTGCCHDPDMPKCCCDIAADACTGVADVARNWAVEVNGCKDDENLFLDTSYKNSEKGIECSTSSGKANTTICMYDNSGHFNRPSFDKAFPMADEVINFFSQDSCGINGGKWHRNSKTCSCNLKYSGTFCLDEAEDKHNIGGRSSSTDSPSIRRVIVTMVSMVMLVLASYVMLHKLRRRGRSRVKYGKVEEDDIEIAVM